MSASTESSAPTVQFVLLSLALAGGLTYALLRLLIRFLKQKQWVVMDYHKKERPMVPKPGGPAILAGFLVGEAALYFYFQAPGLLALMATTGIAGAIGLLDDIVTLGGIVKPASLILASLPILLLGTYDFNLRFPFFGTVFLPIIYPLLILIAIPVVSNTVNTIDVLNGVVSGFMVIASLPILILLLLAGNTVMAAATGVFTVVAAAFYLVHRYPSKIFPGDSGSLSLGAAYGALVIIGRAEMMGVIALIPAILNSFFVISSVKGLVEHRQMKERPTSVSEDGYMSASRSPDAPVTLVRLIVASRPLNEQQVAKAILKLAGFSATLAALTALTMGGF